MDQDKILHRDHVDHKSDDQVIRCLQLQVLDRVGDLRETERPLVRQAFLIIDVINPIFSASI